MDIPPTIALLRNPSFTMKKLEFVQQCNYFRSAVHTVVVVVGTHASLNYLIKESKCV